MQGVGGDAAEVSALILDLAQSLKADADKDSAAASLKAIHNAVDRLLPQLPPSFFEPLVSRDSLSDEQVEAELPFIMQLHFSPKIAGAKQPGHREFATDWHCPGGPKNRSMSCTGC